MDGLERAAWLARRGGWGLGPGQLDNVAASGVEAQLADLLNPSAPATDPWEKMEVPLDVDQPVRVVGEAVIRWLDHFATTSEPLLDRMTWFWHDHFAVSARAVPSPLLLLEHIRLLRRHALGNFRDLLREVTTDGAMLVFLDGARSTVEAPNENYGRELLELYAVGFDAYTEADVSRRRGR